MYSQNIPHYEKPQMYDINTCTSVVCLACENE